MPTTNYFAKEKQVTGYSIGAPYTISYPQDFEFIKKQISSSTSEDEDLMTVRRKKEQERDMYRISKLSLIKFIFLTKIFNFKIRSLDDVSNPR
ncbi:hypothetical protein NQ317_003307 [Molorchus minor]|uniref:Uncharacterized protein n=1 Tax=Molorchus minor TaxID=1323400 RepID=A0ABQ9J118_9CUCU|nr:hypothetical protein NQ317_003307 [Molorchus minor]